MLEYQERLDYCAGYEIKLSNALADGETVDLADWPGLIRWYGFVTDAGGNYIIAPLITASGAFAGSNPCQPVLVQDRDYEPVNVKDAAVARFGDCYVMVYVSGIPPLPPGPVRRFAPAGGGVHFGYPGPDVGVHDPDVVLPPGA